MEPPDDPRYQFQPRHVQVYRWLRWRPWYFVIFLFWTAKWLLRGTPLDDPDWMPRRRDVLRHIWKMSRSRADIKMQWWWEIGELREQLRRRQK